MRRYRLSKKLSPRRRQRVMRVLATPLILRTLLPAFGAVCVSVLAALGVAAVYWPHVDRNGWPFIVVVCALACIVGFGAWAVGHVYLVRWLIRYRSARHGRDVALGDVLRETDAAPSPWRRLELAAYGLSAADRARLTELWRVGESHDPPTVAPTSRQQ